MIALVCLLSSVLFIFESCGHHLDLHVLTPSFPTRRSSELLGDAAERHQPDADRQRQQRNPQGRRPDRLAAPAVGPGFMKIGPAGIGEQRGEDQAQRSEEHTSELQSLMRISYAVFYLKRKKSRTSDHTSDIHY